MKKVFSIIFKIIKYLYIAVLVIYLIFICLHRISIDTSIFGYRLFTINNDEMYPKYKVNDIVIVKDYDASKLKVGDNISYTGDCCGLGGMTINHQIVKIDKEANKIITKGINSPVEDPEIRYKQVIGKIIGKLPVINFIHHILKNYIGIFLAVFLPIIIAIIVLIIRTIRDIRSDKKTKQEPIQIESEPVLKEENTEPILEEEKVKEDNAEIL